ELQRNRRRPARPAVDDALPVEQAHALVDPRQANVPAPGGVEQRGVDVEAAAVVAHVRENAFDAQLDRDLSLACAATVLANVAERLADDAQQRDPLRWRDRCGAAVDANDGRDPGSRGKRARQLVQLLEERSIDSHARTCRSRDLTQTALQLDRARLEVFDPAAQRPRLVALAEQRSELLAKQAQVLAEQQQLLQWAVVQIEADPRQTPVAGFEQRQQHSRAPAPTETVASRHLPKSAK